jgi:MtrB/PioB family decaheme-associated outer membrane protein
MRRSGSTRVPSRGARLAALPPVVAAAAALLLGGAARADDDEQRYTELTKFANTIELGLMWNSADSFQFGNYTGLDKKGFYFLGNIDVMLRGLSDGDDTSYLRMQGLNLGLDSRYGNVELGRQGRFGIFVEYDQLPVFDSETAKTIFLRDGSPRNLVLPPGWMPGPRDDQPGDLQDSIDANMRLLDVDWNRRRIGGGFSLVLPSNLEFDARYDYEKKNGNKLLGALIGVSGGNPRSVIIPEPIDYVTQQFDAALTYNTKDLQLQLGYYGSFFENDNGFTTWQNPYTAQADWDPTAGYMGFDDLLVQDAACVAGQPFAGTCGLGRMHQAPDNMFNQILASGGYNLPRRTRVTLSTAFGWMTQDDHFLPYTVNQNLFALDQTGAQVMGTDLAALPRKSLDGEIFTTVLNFGIDSRPLPKLRLDAGYRFDNRDNKTPRETYVYIPADSEDQEGSNPVDPIAGLESEEARINVPYSYREHQIHFDAGYRLPLWSELVLGYEWQQTERDFQEVEKLRQNTLGATVTSRPASFFNTRIHYEHSWREGSGYDGARSFLAGHTPEFILDELANLAADPDCAPPNYPTVQDCLFENHPLLRKYYLANREADELFTLFNFTPREDVTVGLSLNWKDDNYDDTVVGLTDAKHVSPGIDIAYQVFERVGTYAFYNFAQTEWNQNGWDIQGNDALADATEPDRRWKVDKKDRTHTVGAGFNVDIIPGRLSGGVDYLFADNRGEVDVAVGSALTAPPPVPDTRSVQHNVSLHADYQFTTNFSMRVGYLFAKSHWKEFAYDGLGPTNLICSDSACVIGTGQQSEDYDNNVVSLSMVYKFW